MSARLSPEVALFARMAAFGLIVGVGYWLLTGETAGTVMLVAFGVASLVAAVAVSVGLRGAARASGSAGRMQGGAPAEIEPGPPAPGWAPLLVAIGLGGVALGLAFGPWLSIAGALVAARSAKAWLDAEVAAARSEGRREG